MGDDKGIIGVREIPTFLKGKNVSTDDILDWARKQLRGVEPELSLNEIRKIKSGQINRIYLRPRRPGFFLPDGKFIEAFNYKPEFGEDLDRAEEIIIKEEKNNTWADDENSKFNKSTLNKSPHKLLQMWEHGKRIELYSKDNNTSSSQLLHLLDRRKGPNCYSRHTHQTCLDFYRWKPRLTEGDSIIQWRWERVDDILRFSKHNDVRDYLVTLLETTPLGTLTDDKLSRLLGVKSREQDKLLSSEDLIEFQNFHKKVKSLKPVEKSTIGFLISIITQTKKIEEIT